MISDDESILNNMNRGLYDDPDDSREEKPRSFLHDKKIDTPDSWKESQIIAEHRTHPKTLQSSFFKKMFFGAVGFLAIAIIVAAVSFLGGINSISANNVKITITTRPFVDGGESFPVEVSIANRNRVGLELATLSLEYAENNGDQSAIGAKINRDISTIRSGATHKESFDISLFGEEGSTREITATLQFRVENSNVIYTSKGATSLVIRTSPVLLTATIPENIAPYQEVPLVFTVTGNGTAILENIAMIVKYPDGFNFVRSSSPASDGSRVWVLGDLAPGASRTITVYGSFTGGVNDVQSLQVDVGAQDPRNEERLSTVYNSIAREIQLADSFLSIRTQVGQSTNSPIPISSTSQSTVTVTWTNTLTVPVTNAEIKVYLSGSAYDATRVQSSLGFFNSNTNTVTWGRQQIPGLGSIAPGASGQASFTLAPRPTVTGENPFIEIAVDATGFGADGVKLNATRADVKKLILNSDANLISRTLHYSGPLQNSGAMPPQVGEKTTYTIDWQITNSRNRITGARVSTTLPLWVSWEGVVVPQFEQPNISFNAVTREVVWNVGDIATGSGLAKNVSFKVGIIPSTNQVGNVPELTTDTVLQGYDTITNSTVSVTRRALTTQLLNDTSTDGADGRVVR